MCRPYLAVRVYTVEFSGWVLTCNVSGLGWHSEDSSEIIDSSMSPEPKTSSTTSLTQYLHSKIWSTCSE